MVIRRTDGCLALETWSENSDAREIKVDAIHCELRDRLTSSITHFRSTGAPHRFMNCAA